MPRNNSNISRSSNLLDTQNGTEVVESEESPERALQNLGHAPPRQRNWASMQTEDSLPEIDPSKNISFLPGGNMPDLIDQEMKIKDARHSYSSTEL